MQTARTRDKEATKVRLLGAATAEFAAHGIAGARVDRIAEIAQANKALIYNYFGSKDDLFDAVFGALAERIVTSTPMNPADLAGYAVALSRESAAHPEIGRLTAWYRLERGSAKPLIEAIVENSRAKVEAIEAAQRTGHVSTRWRPEVVLLLITHLSGIWGVQVPEYSALVADVAPRERDEVLRTAVETLLRA